MFLEVFYISRRLCKKTVAKKQQRMKLNLDKFERERLGKSTRQEQENRLESLGTDE